MSTFTLAIRFTTSNFALIHGPDIPGSYAILLLTASDLLLSPVTSTTGYYFCFGSIPSFFLELFLQLSPVAYWAPTHLASLSFSVISFCLFILIMVLKARILKWFAIPFSSGPHSVRPLHHDPPVLGGPTWHGLVSLS